MRSLGHTLDTVSLRAKRQKRFDVGVIREVFAQSEEKRWPGEIAVLKVSDKEGKRLLHLATDSATALLMSYDIEGILSRINPALETLAVDEVCIVHRNANGV